jgi:hypothetical protein
MSKKTSGIDDLISTLVKQHGLEKSIDIARAQVHALAGSRNLGIWQTTLQRLKDMR